MLYGGDLDQLKKLLENKLIAEVKESTSSEGLCKIVMSDGIVFDLCANDLGFWIENPGDDGENE